MIKSYLDQLLTRILSKNPDARQGLILLSCFICDKSLKCPAESGIKSHIVSGQNHICDISTITVGGTTRRRCEIGESDNPDSEDYTLLDP